MPGKGNLPARQESATADIAIRPEVRMQFAQMATAIPTTDGNGSEAIILAILNAKTWDELDDPWDSEKAKDLIGVEMRIDEIIRHQSRYADGLGIFLVVRGERLDTHQAITWATGSVSVVAQLVKGYLLGAFPLYVMLDQSDQPTERGYYPQHLRVIGSGGIIAEVIPEDKQ